MGVPMTSIITVVGSCGLAVGLALQGSLANIAGGFVLLVVKPFKVGHFITVGDISGTVTEMGIFNTKLRTIDNRVVIIPNSTISNATVVNLTELPLRRVDLTFTASYGDDTSAVKDAILAVCDRHPLILKDPAPFAKVSGHKDSAIEYTMRAWCKTEDYWDVYFDLFEQVKNTFDDRGITIPFPQVDVHNKND
jgi:small conductance mechanosensitive channel